MSSYFKGGILAVNLLIADPDEEWLYSAKKYFEECLYQVTMAGSGKEAQLALYNQKFFAIILNVELQNHPGLQVLKFIKTNYPGLKVIMTTEVNPEDREEDQWTREKLKKLGVTEALEKPFEMEDVKGLLEGYQSVRDMLATIKMRKEPGAEEECDLADNKFTKIKIAEFYSSQPILFDVFIKLKSNRYVKILHAGDVLSKKRLDKYEKEKNVEYLYFQKNDLYKYVKFNNYFAKKVLNSKRINSEKKLKLLQNVTEKFLEHSFEEGMKPQIVDQGKEIAENMYLLIQDNQDLYGLLRSYQDFDPNAFTHAYLVSLFSTAIIKQFEWQSKTTLECTALACFFHDIGKMQLPKELLNTKVEDMTEEQFEEYKQHPALGFKMVENNSMVNNSVKQIILQHHEHFDGSGFPFSKRGSKILTLSNIVCLADKFVHIIQDEDKKPIEALKALLGRREQLIWYNSLIVENLIKVFIDPDKKKIDDKIPANSHIVNKKVS